MQVTVLLLTMITLIKASPLGSRWTSNPYGDTISKCFTANQDGTSWMCGDDYRLMNIPWGVSWEKACSDNIGVFQGTRKCETRWWSGVFAVPV
jgi:hypothetical protein